MHRLIHAAALAATAVLALVSCGGGGSSEPPAPGLYPVAGRLAGPPASDLRNPQGITVDAAGNVYVSDTDNDMVRKITPAGVISTLATGLQIPGHLVVGPTGELTVVEVCGVRRVSMDGTVSDFPGSAGLLNTLAFGSATCSQVPHSGVAFDAAGNLYASDAHSNYINKVTPAGEVSVLAGTKPPGFFQIVRGSADGTGAAASFNGPGGTAIDASGNLYVAEAYNNTVRKVTPAGVVTTIAGAAPATGSTDGVGAAARFNLPRGIAIDPLNNLYVADTSNHTIRKITPAGLVSTLAGTPQAAGNADGVGAAARFTRPSAIAFHGGELYVADAGNNAVRKVALDGTVSTFAGLQPVTGFADGSGSAARFDNPQSVVADNAGNLYIADTMNHAVRKVTPGGEVSTLAGSAAEAGSRDGPGALARFHYPTGLVLDGKGGLYVTDNTLPPQQAETTSSSGTVRQITADGVVRTLAGDPSLAGMVNGPASTALFRRLMGLALDGNGNLFVADAGNGAIRKITADGQVSTFFDNLAPRWLSVDAAGNVYAYLGALYFKINPQGQETLILTGGIASQGAFVSIMDAGGDFWVGETWGHFVQRKSQSGGPATTVAGVASTPGLQLGPLPGLLYKPGGLAFIDAKTLAVLTPGGVIKLVLP
ncbi:hypothetical protein [uncultured Ramlibacter sp.]|uniref:NHL domain-containing protein n=1 Tax=uncultured Ramlibacter sp. TaxID=260755 RepID=UPI002618B95A|nr:hypothetical protein [uncultured Ramlibacter sp.]